MRFLKVSVSEFMCNIKNNIFSALIMAVVSVSVICFLSIYLYQTSKFAPFKKLDIDKGFILESGYTVIDTKELKSVKKIYSIYSQFFQDDGRKISVVGYNEWIWKNWQCRLSEGEWFQDTEGKEIPIVVLDNNNQYSVGDEINLRFMFLNQPDSGYKGKVTGIGNLDATILTANLYYAGNQSFSSLYTTAVEYNSGSTVILFPMEYIPDIRDLYESSTEMAIFEYEDDITDEEFEMNNTYLMNNTGYAGLVYDDFLELSEKELLQMLLVYVPLTVTGFIITLIGTYTISYLTAGRSIKHIAVYSLIGASKKKTTILMLSNAIGTTVLSVILFFAGMEAYSMYAKRKSILLVVNNVSVSVVVVLYLLYLLFMTWVLISAISKKSNRQLLIEANRLI